MRRWTRCARWASRTSTCRSLRRASGRRSRMPARAGGWRAMAERKAPFRLSAAMRILIAIVPALLAGCGPQVYQTYYSEGEFDTNYVTFEHPFTEAGEADARRRASAQ